MDRSPNISLQSIRLLFTDPDSSVCLQYTQLFEWGPEVPVINWELAHLAKIPIGAWGSKYQLRLASQVIPTLSCISVASYEDYYQAAIMAHLL